jgi:hypothetical protein
VYAHPRRIEGAWLSGDGGNDNLDILSVVFCARTA